MAGLPSSPYNVWAAQALFKACYLSETPSKRAEARAELLRTVARFQPHLDNLDDTKSEPQLLAILEAHIARVDSGWRRDPSEPVPSFDFEWETST